MIFAPLLAALCASLLSAEAGLAIAAAALLAGTVATATWVPEHVASTSEGSGRVALPSALWLLYVALALTAAALGAIDISCRPRRASSGTSACAGVLLAGMAVATVGRQPAGRPAPLARPTGAARGRAAGADGAAAWR